jgi:hypothetical protein
VYNCTTADIDNSRHQRSQLPKALEGEVGGVVDSRGWVRSGCGVKVAVRGKIEARNASTCSYPIILACKCVNVSYQLTGHPTLSATPSYRPHHLIGHHLTGHIFGVAIAHVCYHNDAISRVYDLRLCL